MKSATLYKMMIVMSVILACCVNAGAAFDGNEEDLIVRTKTIGGPVNVIRPHYMTIDITRDPESTVCSEMYFPITGAVEFVNKGPDQIEEGNVVEITYEEYSKLDEKGEERYVKRILTAVKFLNKGTAKKLISR